MKDYSESMTSDEKKYFDRSGRLKIRFFKKPTIIQTNVVEIDPKTFKVIRAELEPRLYTMKMKPIIRYQQKRKRKLAKEEKAFWLSAHAKDKSNKDIKREKKNAAK